MATLLNAAVTTAVSAVVGQTLYCSDGGVRSAVIQGVFTYGSSGTTVDVWVQTSVDAGATWIDIANFHFTTSSAKFVYNLSAATAITTEYTPTDGSLTANTSKDGILGNLFRTKLTSTGTYGGTTTLRVDVNASGPLGALVA